jgi:hypothetical protein
LRVGSISFAWNQNANNCFAFALIHVISKGVFFANCDKFHKSSCAFSQLQSIAVKAIVLCCKLLARVII